MGYIYNMEYLNDPSKNMSDFWTGRPEDGRGRKYHDWLLDGTLRAGSTNEHKTQMMFSAEIQGSGRASTISINLLKLIVDTAQYHRLLDPSGFHSKNLTSSQKSTIKDYLHNQFEAARKAKSMAP